MVNKKGLIRIIEASIAVAIVISVLFILNYRGGEETQEDLGRLITPILEEIALDSQLRDQVVQYDGSDDSAIRSLNEFIRPRLRADLEFEVKICELGELCPLDSYPTDEEGNPLNVYAKERVISASIKSEGFSPKKVKIFVWRPQ